MLSAPENECRTFALRGGRITAGQRRALTELSPRYGLNPNIAPEWDSVFGRRAPIALEIGGGYGEAVAQLARVSPEYDYVVAEVYPPALGAILNKIAAAELPNVRVVRADARAVLREMFADGGVNIARIYFPDPWPKKRHHKRRLINPAFVALLAQKIAPGGFAHIATDCAHYAMQIRDCFAAAPQFAATTTDIPRPQTRFAARAKEEIADFVYLRRG